VSSRFPRFAASVMLVFCLGGLVAACGKKGAPAVPKGEASVYPRAYPRDTAEPTPAANPTAFPSLEPANTNIDPTQPRSTN